MDASIGMQLAPVNKLEVYGGAGITYYFLDIDNGNVANEVGWLLEAGAEFKLAPRVGIFAEAIWRDVNGTVDNNRLSDIERNHVAIDLNGFTVNVGLVFR